MKMTWLKSVMSSDSPLSRTARGKAKGFRPGLTELEQRRVMTGPAANFLYVDSNFASQGSSLVWNSGRPDAVNSGLVLGTNAFTTVNAANTAAVAGNTIDIAAGTYTVDSGPTAGATTVSVSESWIGSEAVSSSNSLIAGTNATTLIPNSDTSATNSTGSGWITVVDNANLNLTNLIVNGETFSIGQGVRYEQAASGSGNRTGTSTITNVDFSNIGPTYTAGTAPLGFAVVDLDGVINVSNSSFSNIGRTGVQYDGSTASGTVSNIVYTGKGSGDTLDYAVQVGDSATATLTASYITDNLGTSTYDGTVSAGAGAANGGTLNAYGNLFKNDSIGLANGAAFDDSGDQVADTSVLNAEYNNFIGDTIAVQTDSTPAADLNNNYFGSTAAPTMVDGTVTTVPANAIQDIATASTATTHLFKAAWVFNGTSPANYLQNTSFFAVGNDIGDNKTPATLNVYDGTGQTADLLGTTTTNVSGGTNSGGIFSINPFGTGFLGGLSVAIGDWTGNYRPDVAVSNAQGDSSTEATISVYDILTGDLLTSFRAFSGYVGGAQVSFANITGSGAEAIVVGKGQDAPVGSPAPVDYSADEAQVEIFENNTTGGATMVASTNVFANFAGGVNVAAGDLGKTGKDEIVVGANSAITSTGGLDQMSGPLDNVVILQFTPGAGTSLVGVVPPPTTTTPPTSISTPVDGTVAQVGNFFAFSAPPNGMGVTVATGDLDGTGYDQIIIGTGYGYAPGHVETFSYASASGSFASSPTLATSYFVYGPGTPDSAFTGGVRVGAGRVTDTSDFDDQVIVGEGPTNGATGTRTSTNGDISVLAGNPATSNGYATATLSDFNVFGPLLAGVYVS